MLMPAPIEVANPTSKVCPFWCLAKAAANSGADVDTEPSINPAGHIAGRTPDAASCPRPRVHPGSRSDRSASPRTARHPFPHRQGRRATGVCWRSRRVQPPWHKSVRLRTPSVDFIANSVQRLVLRQPDRTALQESSDIFFPDKRETFAKTLFIHFQKQMSMTAWPSPRTPCPDSGPRNPRRMSCRCGYLPPPRRSRLPAARARSNLRNSSRQPFLLGLEVMRGSCSSIRGPLSVRYRMPSVQGALQRRCHIPDRPCRSGQAGA